MAWAILDSNVYVGHWERGLYVSELQMIRRNFVIRHSAVVLSELRRGVRTGDALKIVEGLYKVAHVQWEPAADDWWQAGRLIREIGDEQTWDRNKRRDFQNDALIGLTARRYGATVVTANRNDFELLARELDVRILVVRADPGT